jgi:hypothetical protein
MAKDAKVGLPQRIAGRPRHDIGADRRIAVETAAKEEVG